MEAGVRMCVRTRRPLALRAVRVRVSSPPPPPSLSSAGTLTSPRATIRPHSRRAARPQRDLRPGSLRPASWEFCRARQDHICPGSALFRRLPCVLRCASRDRDRFHLDGSVGAIVARRHLRDLHHHVERRLVDALAKDRVLRLARREPGDQAGEGRREALTAR